MIVSTTEVLSDFDKYLDLAAKEEILITRDGVPVARLIGLDGDGHTSLDPKTIKDETMVRR